MTPTGTPSPCAQLLEPEIRELVREGAFSELRHALEGVHPADIADILTELGPDDAALAFRFLPRDDAGAVFGYLSQEFQEGLIAKLGQEQAVRVVEGMSADDRARILDELPHEVAQRLVASLSPETRKVTQAILGYPARSVGRLMTPDYIRVRPEWTIQQALDHIRKYGQDAETINVVYVVDEHGVLIDDLRLRQVFLSDPNETIESIMNRQFVTLRADHDRSEAVDAMAKYDRTALPVVDSRGVLVGIVTHDDVADVAQQEATEDMQKMGGLEALDEPYTTISMFRLVKKRVVWLAVLFVGEMFTQSVMAGFEHDIEKAAVLATFVPLIVSSGGNSGSQATSLIIRAMAVGEITLKDWWRVMRRELASGALLGLILGVIGIVRVHIWGWLGWFRQKEASGSGAYTAESLHVQGHYHVLAVTIGVAVLGVVLWGTLCGSMLPFILRRFKMDPATSSAPFVATLVDVIGVLIYFTAAVSILRGTLL